jgi:hypothetical protein
MPKPTKKPAASDLSAATCSENYWMGVDFKKGDGVKISGKWHTVAYAELESPYIGVECSNMNHPACKHNAIHVHAAKCFIEDYLLQNK